MPTQLKAHTATADVAGKNGHSLISGEKFRELYAWLVKCELLERHLGSSTASLDEAVAAVGITLDLGREDTVVLGPRTYAANLIKGVPLRALLAHYKNGHGSVPLTFSAVNAVSIAGLSAVRPAGLATGAALANKMARSRHIAVAFIDGDAVALAECKAAFEVASANQLPVLYVLHASPGRKLKRALSEAAKLVPVIAVDAHDVVAIYRVAQESIARVRQGYATIIICVDCHMNGTPRCALASMERYLEGKKLSCNEWKQQAIAEFERELTAACLPQANPLA
ncbi:MAG: hypothetical protein JOZ83_17390 [Silvibacterium sp.]|nr:hypothetical protein [Silvibacterium sp.]